MIIRGRIPTVWALNTYVQMELTVVSQDVATNSSKVRMVVKIDKVDNYNDNFHSTSATITGSVGSVSINQTGLSYDIRNGNNITQTMINKVLTIPHNSDGSKIMDVNFSFKLNPVGFSPTNDYANGSGSVALPPIPRVSRFTFSSSAYYFDANISGSIQRNSSAFKHTISYTTPNGSTVVAVSDTSSTDFSFKIPITYANQIPNTEVYNSTITLTTKNGSTTVGSVSKEIALVLPTTYVPVISSLSPTGENSLIGNNTTTAYNYLGNLDRVRTSISISNQYGATTKNVEYRLLSASNVEHGLTTVGGTASASILAPQVSTNELFTLQARAIDSRGRMSNWFSAPIKVRSHAYQSPTINTLSVRRSPTSETELTGTLSGWRVQSVYNAGGTSGQTNTANMTVKYRKRGTTTWTNLNTSTVLSSTSYTLSFTGHTFPPGESYELQATVTDKFGKSSSTAITLVGAVFVHMDFGPNGVGIGKDHSDSNYDLEVGSGGVNSEGLYRWNGQSIQNVQLTQDNGAALSISGDANNIVQTGFYMCTRDNTTNLPDGGHPWKYLIVMRHNSLYIGQIAIDFSNSYVATRSKENDTWRSWVKMANENSINSIISNSLSGYAKKSDIPVVKKTARGTSYRYEDGTQIIYGSGSFSTSSLVELTFPEAFKSSTKPLITLTVEQNDRWKGVLASVITNTSTGFSASVMSHEKQAFASFNVHYVAHGQWK